MQSPLKALAVAALALSILAAAIALYASTRAVAIQGPGALVVTPAGEVWLAVDKELWRLDAQGELLERAAAEASGLPTAPANLVRHPSGALVATVRDDPSLYFLDAGNARLLRRLQPQWPDELAPHRARAINLAFAADGRIAIATGGGHAVALFDPEGRFIARTPEGTYRFSNGLWWRGDTLWTTDTNRHRLLRFAQADLTSPEVVSLGRGVCCGFLGPARAASTDADARVALIRFDARMVRGEVVRVAETAGDHAIAHPLADFGTLEPRDMDWLPDRLLVSDGQSMSILQSTSAGAPLLAFGSAEVQTLLRERLQQRDLWRRLHRGALVGAGIAFLMGLAFAIVEQRRARQAQGAERVDLSHLGTPRASWQTLARQQWNMLWPLLPAVLGMPVKLLLPSEPATWRLAWFACEVVLFAFGLWRVQRWAKRAQTPEYEAMWNQIAMGRLKSADARTLALEPEERVLETFMLGAPWRPRWCVLTDSRLLLFRLGGFEHRRERAIPRSAIAAVSDRRGALRPPRGWTPFWNLRGGSADAWLEVAFDDGTVLSGAVRPRTLAERIVQQLDGEVHAGRAASGSGARVAEVRAHARSRPVAAISPARAALLSALIPGLGQWAQRRGATALMLFIVWLIQVAFVTVPVVWALLGPRSEVRSHYVVLAFAGPLLISLMAALDAWRMAPRREAG